MTNGHGFQTEVEFDLPKGYLDDTGMLHRRGTMRLATAADEILPLRDLRVQQNEAYLAVIVLSRVVTRLGSLPGVHPGTIEGLFASDMAFLQRLYEKLNTSGDEELDLPSEHRAAAGAAPKLRRVTAVGEA